MKDLVWKWYKNLGLEQSFDFEFGEILRKIDLNVIPSENSVDFLVGKKDYQLNMVYILAQCESMYKEYIERGIPDQYLQATLCEIAMEVKSCQATFGVLGIYEISWFACVVKGNRLFRIGRLNFMLEEAGEWCSGGPVRNGDKLVSVHIPGGEKLDDLACYQSFEEAERFVLKYFPEHNFKYFMCHSWLLDPLYEKFLKEGSNISKFRNMFKAYRREETDDVIKFVFGKNVKRNNIGKYQPKNDFQKKLQKYILEGGKLYVTCGIRSKIHADI